MYYVAHSPSRLSFILYLNNNPASPRSDPTSHIATTRSLKVSISIPPHLQRAYTTPASRVLTTTVDESISPFRDRILCQPHRKDKEIGRRSNTTTVIPDHDRPPPFNKLKSSFSPFSYFRTSRKTNTEARDVGDVEKAPIWKTPRPIRLLAPLYGGLGAALAICEFF
jgi:hypothetical protein